ncbi:hypothetical protein SPI_03377 [Niveomyces insectorum RCEF 264]|uniref:Uncharacterized protein n=1 Tax=Niveomyces insectorum RCEF 264 TaxID=1081102 RepID=A0A162MNY1_9HYPO|nr:hypothetical protein SPI_03377 [Niveomyces insectorum RCEF 264]
MPRRRARSLPPLAQLPEHSDVPFSTSTCTPFPERFLGNVLGEQAAAQGIDAGSGGGEGGDIEEDNDGDERERANQAPVALVFSAMNCKKENDTAQKVDAWETGSSGTDLHAGRSRHTWKRGEIPEDPNIGVEATRSLKLILVAIIRCAATTPIVLKLLAFAVLIPFVLFIVLYAAPRLSVMVLKKCATAAFGYVWEPFHGAWHVGSGVLSAIYHYSLLSLGTCLGLITPTVLPALDENYAVMLPSIQRVPVAHVDGMVLATQDSAPHVSALRCSLDAEPESSKKNYLRLPDNETLSLPDVIFKTVIPKIIEGLAVANDDLGSRMRTSLEVERNRLRRLRRALRDPPVARRFERSSLDYPATGGWWSSIWRAVYTTLSRWIQPSAKDHLLRQVVELVSILKHGLKQRHGWTESLQDPRFERIDRLQQSVCNASMTLHEAKWLLEATVDELVNATLGSSDNNSSLVRATDNTDNRSTAADLVRLSRNLVDLRVVQADFGHLCLLVPINREAIVVAASKIAMDLSWYEEALGTAQKMRLRVNVDPPFDPPSVLANEKELDVIASGALAEIQK